MKRGPKTMFLKKIWDVDVSIIGDSLVERVISDSYILKKAYLQELLYVIRPIIYLHGLKQVPL